MATTWDDVKFETQNASGIPTGNYVGMIGRVIFGYNQVNDPTLCGLGSCCPAEGAVSVHMGLFNGTHPAQGCFAMGNNMFWDFPWEFLNDGTANPNWNGCPGPGNATGFNTCGTSGLDSVTPGTGTSPCQCNLGEFYRALPNIDFTQVGPGAQWLVVNGTDIPGQLDGCIEILKIIDNQTDWDNNTVTCPSNFLDNTMSNHNAGTSISHGLLWGLAINGSPTNIVETSCDTCIENLYGCLDSNAINTYWDCVPQHVPTVFGQIPNLDSGCCIYPGCPDSSALNYDPANSDGCGTWSNGVSTVDPTDTSCCQYPGCSDGVTVQCDISTPIVTPTGNIPGPIGCVANYALDCFGNSVIPATGGILVNPALDSCFTNEIPPSPNHDCFYVGCTDQTASNYTPGANGCVYPTLDGTECCEYEGCMDPTALNYGESCDSTQVYTPAQLTGPCVPDNCIDPPIVGCMDDGCCVDGVLNTVDPTPTTSCPNGTHLCPQQGSGVSFNSNYPPGCTPGVDCVACDFDPLAEEQGMPYENYCTCEGGWYCNIQNNPGCTPGLDCCIDIYASPLSQPYNWSDPFAFGPCGGNTGVPCTGVGSSLEDCQEVCSQAELEECAVFVNDRQGNVYFYGPPDTNPNQLTHLFRDEQFNENMLPDGTPLYNGNIPSGTAQLGWQSGTASWDIANAVIPGTIPEQHKVWLYSCRVVDIDPNSADYGTIILQGGVPKGIIREYDVAIDPFSIDPGGANQPAGTINPVYSRDIDITDVCQNFGADESDMYGNSFKTIGNALVAKDDITLISVSDKALEIDISGPVATAQELFMLPNPSFPTVNTGGPASTTQAKSTGDVVIDVNTGDLTITYWYPPINTTGIIGKFSLNAGVGAQMGDSTGNPTSWYETVSNNNPTTPYIFGLFKWDNLWYGMKATSTGGEVYDFDNNTLTVNTQIGTVTTLPPDINPWPNDIVGASQKDGCTPDDPCGCMDPLALNYDPNATVHCPPCIYPPEPRFGCLPRLTKEEFLMNVVQKPETYSDVFIERGKVSVFERPQRLAQVSTIGELEIHGYGYYNILTQQ